MLGSKQGVQSAFQEIQNQLRGLRPRFRDMPPELREELRSLLIDLLGNLDLGGDRRCKEEAYAVIARFLSQRFHQPLPVCLAVTHRLCQEYDPTVLSQAAVEARDAAAVDAFHKEALDAIGAIKVHYQTVERFQKYLRKIEIYLFKKTGEEVHLTTLEQEMIWLNLPSEVREQLQRETSSSSVSFCLFRREA
jgi:hypothetical protein